MKLHPVSYPTLAWAALGPKAERAANWAVIVQQLGACVTYVVFVGDVLQPIAARPEQNPRPALCGAHT